MRCPECNKFVSMELSDEVDVESLDYEDLNIHASIRIYLNCGECGDNLKEGVLEIDDNQDVLTEHAEAHLHRLENYEIELVDIKLEATEKAITRRQTNYGARVVVKASCTCGGLRETFELTNDMPSSDMDEMV